MKQLLTSFFVLFWDLSEKNVVLPHESIYHLSSIVRLYFYSSSFDGLFVRDVGENCFLVPMNRSALAWHSTHNVASGTISKRSGGILWPHASQIPYAPLISISSACSRAPSFFSRVRIKESASSLSYMLEAASAASPFTPPLDGSSSDLMNDLRFAMFSCARCTSRSRRSFSALTGLSF